VNEEFWVGQVQSLHVYYAMDSGELGLDAEMPEPGR
jgi:hypothetical protein